MQESIDRGRRQVLLSVFSPVNARRNAVVALVVGSILNAINQSDAVLNGDGLNWGTFILNYCVPFCVASWGSYNSMRARA